MRNVQIGQQLRNYRLSSGLSAEEVATRLGVSRAALYRYEKGEVIKLDTVKRLSELLGITSLSLLGVGISYYNNPCSFQSYLLEEEGETDHLLVVDRPICSLITSDSYDAVLGAIHAEMAVQSAQHGQEIFESGLKMVETLSARKRQYKVRRPGIISLISGIEMQRVLRQGVGAGLPISDKLRKRCIQVAIEEATNIAEQMEAEPMGLQFGLMSQVEINGPFYIMRTSNQAMLVINPFPVDCNPSIPSGISMTTRSEDAVTTHHDMAQTMWAGALKGKMAAAKLREMIAAASTSWQISQAA